MRFKLDTGVEVKVDAIHIEHPFLGLLLGIPTTQMLIRDIESISKTLEAQWGKRHTFTAPLPEQLEPAEFHIAHAWLADDKDFGDFHGRQVVLIWFPSMKKAVQEELADFFKTTKWEDISEGYCY